MSALAAILLALLAGVYVALPILRERVGELPHELDRLLLEGELETESASLREWARAAGEYEGSVEAGSD